METDEAKFGTAAHQASFKFTVHEYVKTGSAQEVDRGSVLEEAYQTIVDASATSNGWQSPRFPVESGRGVGVNASNRNAYTLRTLPPKISCATRIPRELKKWGAEVTEDEVFCLEDLDDFISTDLQYIFSKKSFVNQSSAVTQTSVQPRPNKRARTYSPSPEPQPEPEQKKRKLKYGSLVSVIPRPHVYPSPYSSSMNHSARGLPFKKTKPEFIAPYSSTPSSSDVRVAWIVPIRGKLPWDNATSADFLEKNDAPIPSTDPSSAGQILWTQASLRKFWEFLLDLRKARSLGLLAISFHAARQPKQSNAWSSTSINPSAVGLSGLDYMKVYHDAPNTLFVRNALDLWQYLYQDESRQVKKIRMLKGSKLVLLDEVSQGIQIS
ncbi:hypothetical protein D9613_011156 [Agrocybe pediades]|uniref:Uncharacterized protein n=1 Tax=Agrocybe pediades TaxID=84607 RepID=A0A8H4QKR9_9AGAR|nr:hypothetical protein D9613_011156 [Agrocybe pediades]